MATVAEVYSANNLLLTLHLCCSSFLQHAQCLQTFHAADFVLFIVEPPLVVVPEQCWAGRVHYQVHTDLTKLSITVGCQRSYKQADWYIDAKQLGKICPWTPVPAASGKYWGKQSTCRCRDSMELSWSFACCQLPINIPSQPLVLNKAPKLLLAFREWNLCCSSSLSASESEVH